jgi:hypothetical protein
MRLSEDKARRLSALVWRERARRFLPLVILALVVLGAFTAILRNQMARADRTLDVQVRSATVVNIKKLAASRGAAIVTIHLDDGHDVDAFSALGFVPAPGEHVVVNVARHTSGRLTYDIARVTD